MPEVLLIENRGITAALERPWPGGALRSFAPPDSQGRLSPHKNVAHTKRNGVADEVQDIGDAVSGASSLH